MYQPYRLKVTNILAGILMLIFLCLVKSLNAQSFGDNMGNHTAAMDLNMKSHNVVNAAGVVIGSSIFLNNSIALQIDGANKALLLTRIKDTTAIENPVNGMLVYATSDDKFYARQAGTWISFGGFSNGQTAINGEVGSISIAGDSTVQIAKTGKNFIVSAKSSAAIWNAGKLMNRSIAVTAPTAGQVLVWNEVSQLWEPSSMSASNLIAGNGLITDSIVTTLNGNLRKLPVSSFLLISDTSALLSSRLKLSDTASMLSPYLKAASLNGKLNTVDTTVMLNSYLRKGILADSLTAVQSRIQSKLSIADTSSMLSNYAKSADINAKLNAADTTGMLNSYLRKGILSDSLTAVQSRIQSKLSIADTSSMLSNYAKSADISAKLNSPDTT